MRRSSADVPPAASAAIARGVVAIARARIPAGETMDGRATPRSRRFAGDATPPRAEGAAGAGARAMSAADIVANLARVGSLARAPRGAWSGEGAKEKIPSKVQLSATSPVILVQDKHERNDLR